MGRDIYIGGKVGTNNLPFVEFAAELESRGHRVLEKWWERGRLQKPYLQHPELSQKAAVAMVNAAYNSDISILFHAEDILGAAIEFGVALASTKVRPDKQVIVVHPPESRQSVFYAHPAVIVVEGLARVREMPWYLAA